MQTKATNPEKGIDGSIETATDLTVVHDALTDIDEEDLTDNQLGKLQEAASHIDSVAVSIFAKERVE